MPEHYYIYDWICEALRSEEWGLRLNHDVTTSDRPVPIPQVTLKPLNRGAVVSIHILFWWQYYSLYICGLQLRQIYAVSTVTGTLLELSFRTSHPILVPYNRFSWLRWIAILSEKTALPVQYCILDCGTFLVILFFRVSLPVMSFFMTVVTSLTNIKRFKWRPVPSGQCTVYRKYMEPYITYVPRPRDQSVRRNSVINSDWKKNSARQKSILGYMVLYRIVQYGGTTHKS